MKTWISRLTLALALCAQLAMAEPTATPININTATMEQLSQVKGIGPAKAAAIIKYREEKGPFSSTEELTQVRGIGKKLVSENQSLLVTE